MRSSDELKHFWKFVNAVDVLDAAKNEVMVWVADEGKFEVDFHVIGKGARARMRLNENDKCAVTLFDALQQDDGQIVIDCEDDEAYIKQAQRVIAYLNNPHDVC